MAILSGKSGSINGIPAIAQWQLSLTAAEAKRADSSTQGGTGRDAGPQSASGSWTQNHVLPTAVPGESVTFVGYIGSTYSANATAIVTSLGVTWSWSDASFVKLAYAFECSGVPTFPNDATAPAILDATVVKGCKCYPPRITPEGGAAVNVLAVASATLTLSAPTASYGNSDAPCAVGRIPGGPLDWTLDLVVHNQAQQFAIGTNVIVELFVGPLNTDEKFYLKYGRVMGYENLSVNPETGEVVSQTMKIAMNSSADADGAIGEIKVPGNGTAVWP